MVNPSLYSSSVVKVKLGTWPTTQGRHYWDGGGGYTGIRSITVVHSYLGVSMIQVEYDLFGKPVLGEEYRGPQWPLTFMRDTEREEKVILDFPSEFLIAVSYDYDLDEYEGALCNLYFKTNKRMMGPFGRSSQGGPRLQCSVEGGIGAIVGFFGLADRCIDFIGLYIAVLCPTADFFDKMQEQGHMPYRTSPLSTPSPSSTM